MTVAAARAAPGRARRLVSIVDMKGSRRVDQRTREGAELKADTITAIGHSADGVARSPPLLSARVPVNPRHARRRAAAREIARARWRARRARPRDPSAARRYPRW